MTLKIFKFENVAPDLLAPWLDEARKRMSDVHPNRLKEWALSRYALAACFEIHGINLFPDECIFKSFQEIPTLPAWKFSLSHSKDLAAAWLEPAAKFRGLGLDIEYLDRKVPPQVKSRLSHPHDISLDELPLWSLKEAAYKALPLLAQQDIWLNRIVIQNETFHLENSPFKGQWNLETIDAILIARAWLT